MTGRRWMAALLVSMLLPVLARAEALEIVRDGVSRAPVVVSGDATHFTRLAAQELAEYIEKTTGARPEVLQGRPEPLPERALWVGYQPVLDELFPDLDFEFKYAEEILIAAGPAHLVLVGRDRWDPDHLEMETREGPVEVQQEYGTANAVYTFIQDHLGVRWLWPGELGTDILERTTLAFEPFEIRYHPQIRYRSGLFWWSTIRPSPHSISYDWTRRQRLKLDSLNYDGHAFGGWWERFHETHPEYFALQPDGQRSGWPSPGHVKMCQSNPAVAEQWLALVEERRERNPNQVVFSAATNDGQYTGHCVCENCLAWDHPDGELRRFIWQGLSQQYVALSNREVRFANRCARLLRERYPDEELFVIVQSYGFTRPPPIDIKPDDNVIIASVANFLGRGDFVDRMSPSGQTHREQFAGWGEAARHIFWRPNTGSPAGWHQAQPDISIDAAIEDFRWVAELGAIGIHIDIIWEHWATQGPQYYVMTHMAWDPYQDGHAVMDDYYARGFGPAADAVAAYWRLLEDTRNAFVEGDREYYEVYDAAFFEKAYALLTEADEAAGDAREIYRERIAFFRLGLDYTRLNIDSREAAARVRESSGTDEAARQRVVDNWAEINRIARDPRKPLNWVGSTIRRQGVVNPDNL